MTMFEFSERKVIQNRNVVREVDRHSTRELRWSIFMGFLFAGLMCLYNWQQHRMIDYGYRIEVIKKEQSQLEESRRKLSLDKESLETPARITKLAQERLGLVTPKPAQLIYDSLGDSTVLGQPAMAWRSGTDNGAAAGIRVSNPSN
jgi:cell division protein FtsL